jgi:hypothetical protein
MKYRSAKGCRGDSSLGTSSARIGGEDGRCPTFLSPDIVRAADGGCRCGIRIGRDASDDPTLEARVRAQLGRLVSHPLALEVAASGRRVTLLDPILSHEAAAALRCAQRVHGVAAVEDRLSRHDHAGRLPALQGGVARPGPAAWDVRAALVGAVGARPTSSWRT